jgi:hypothetical protein
MKIVDRKTFLAMPPGVVFNKFSFGNLGEPCIKGETWGNDFLVQYLDTLECDPGIEYLNTRFRLEKGESIPLDFNCQGRDGLFEDEQLFAVWDGTDVAALIERLTACRAT